MKIIHLLSQNHLTGAEVYAVTLAAEQIKNNSSVYQISNGFYKKSDATQYNLEVETKSKWTFLKNVFWLRKFIKQQQIDLIHTHSRAAAKLAFWSTIGTKTAIVSTIHGQQHYSLSKRLFNHYGQFLICVCENIQKHLTQDFKYNPESLKILRNPLDQSLYSFKELPRYNPAIVDENSYAFKIAIIGRTTGPKKERTEQVIRAITDYQSQNPNIKIETTVIGGELTDLALRSSDKINLFQNNHINLSSEIYRQYDLIIGSGRVAMEALISGIPTVAFGETDFIGLIRPGHFRMSLQSNFGDINPLKVKSGPIIQRNQFFEALDFLLSIKTEADKHSFQAELKLLSEWASNEFSLITITKKIQRLYESAFFLKNYPKWIPILMYHKIPKADLKSKHKIFVQEKKFEKHLKFFKNQGFETITFNQLKDFRTKKRAFKDFPKKPLILTFDDGYVDNLENADPLLKKYNFKAQIFLLANKEIQSNFWDQNQAEPAHPIVSHDQRQLWKNSNFEVGSHGFNHEKITDMTADEAYDELCNSKKLLESEFNQPVSVFAFTYGISTTQAAEIAALAGYDYAVNTDTGGLILEQVPYQIFRVNIFPDESLFSLWKKTRIWYRSYYFRKRKQ